MSKILTDEATVKLALEALLAATPVKAKDPQMQAVAIVALQEALEQPVQEPVAMRMPKVGDKVVCIEDESLGTVVYLTAGGSPEIKFDDGSHGTYMLREFAELFEYTTPPAQEFVCSTGLCHYKPAAQRQWVGLTNEEKQELVSDEIGRVRDYEDYADAIEAKLKEKNA
jgi:hypothetical protein